MLTADLNKNWYTPIFYDRTFKTSERKKNLAIGALFLIVLAVVILIDAVKNYEAAFSDDCFWGEEVKLFRIYKANAKKQIARIPKMKIFIMGKFTQAV